MSPVSAARLASLERRAEALRSSRTTGCPAAAPLVPDIIEFCLGADYLNMGALYPRQATLLKVMTLQVELLTDFDALVIEEWRSGFDLDAEEGRYVGRFGIAPDVYDRIDWCLSVPRRMFKELVFVGGRRGGKTYLCAVLAAYQLLHFLSLGHPQGHFGLPPNKRLMLPIYAGNRQQAKANMFLDLRNLVEGAPVFEPFLADVLVDRVRLWSPRQVADRITDTELAAFEIAPKEATPLAGRGPASIALGFDEMAWMANRGANRSAEEVYDSASPSLHQFAGDEVTFCASSPWQQIGQFHENYVNGLSVEADGSARFPGSLVVQLPSSELYRDWDLTGPDGLESKPGGPTFPRLERPIISEEQVAEEYRKDPRQAAVELGAEWAATQDALLSAAQVQKVFALHRGERLEESNAPLLRHGYRLHLDPAKFRDNFAGVLAHRDKADGETDGHAVVDKFMVWSPKDFDDGEVNFRVVLADLCDLIDKYQPRVITIDQYEREYFMEHLQEHINRQGLRGRVTLSRYKTTAGDKFARALTFRRLVQLDLVHAPMHRLAFDELTFLQLMGTKVEAPTSGPVKTDDIADSIIAVVTDLLGAGAATREALRSAQMHATSSFRGIPTDNPIAQAFSAAGNRGRIPRGTLKMTQQRRRRYR